MRFLSTRRIGRSAGALVAALACSAGVALTGIGAASAEAPAQTSVGPKVQVGLNDPNDPTIAILEFMPEDITVPVDTPVTWDWKGTIEPHSVTFVPTDVEPPNELTLTEYLAPQPPTGAYDGTTTANSGLMPLGPTPATPFEMSFGKTGDYKYYCVIHPNMTGTVTVVDDRKDADSAASIAKRAKADQKRYLAEGRAAKKKLERAKPKKTANADGTMTWTVEMGITTKHTDVLAFAPVTADIKTGDWVEFVNRSKAPHTATFSNETPTLTNPLDEASNVPAPGPSPVVLGSVGLFNTGRLPQDAPAAPGQPVPPLSQRRFTFMVPEAGTYEYYCIFHIASGMTGDITAEP